jgi:hypothetical protein
MPFSSHFVHFTLLQYLNAKFLIVFVWLMSNQSAFLLFWIASKMKVYWRP